MWIIRVQYFIGFREVSTFANSLFGVIARGAPETEGANGRKESSLIMIVSQIRINI